MIRLIVLRVAADRWEAHVEGRAEPVGEGESELVAVARLCVAIGHSGEGLTREWAGPDRSVYVYHPG